MNTLLALALSAAAGPIAPDFRGSREYWNDIYTIQCRELFLGDKSLGWVAGGVSTTVGLVVRYCRAEQAPPYEDNSNPNSPYGGVDERYSLVNLKTAAVSPLDLPKLGYFANPAFCGGSVAYWGRDSGGSWSLVVADLKTRQIVAEAPVEPFQYGTDYANFLNQASWNSSCTQATFSDSRFIKDTVLPSQSNQPLHPTPTAAEAPASGAGERRR